MIGVDGHWQQHLTPPQTDFTLRATTVETPGWSVASEALGTTEMQTEMEPALRSATWGGWAVPTRDKQCRKIAAMEEKLSLYNLYVIIAVIFAVCLARELKYK